MTFVAGIAVQDAVLSDQAARTFGQEDLVAELDRFEDFASLDYGRKNPGKTALIAFGVGVGIGMLLLISTRRGRMSRYGEPVVNALSNLAMEFIRTL